MYGALTCGVCKACREGRDNLCENVGGIMGFHVDGFARELVNMPARLVIPVPPGVAMRDAACAPIAFATVQHMLFDNAKLEPGETILVHAGGSGIGTAAIQMAKAIGCTVITTVGDDAKIEKAKALGADHVINYRNDRFEGVVRKLTAKKGVDVVFEHVGAETFNGSLLASSAAAGSSPAARPRGRRRRINLMQLFQQQYRIIGSFGASMRNIRESLAKMAAGMLPVIDTEVAARRVRARPGAARKPAGVRQDHRHVLNDTRREASAATASARLRQIAPSTRCWSTPSSDAIAVALRADAAYRPPAHGRYGVGALMRSVGPWLPSTASARANLAAAFPEKSPEEIEEILAGVWDNLGRVAAEFAHLDRLRILDPDHPGAEPTSTYDQRIVRPVPSQLRARRQAGAGLRRASRQLGTARRCAAAAYKLDTDDALSPPNIARHRRRGAARSRAGMHGHADPHRPRCAVRLRACAGAAAAMSPCWSTSTIVRGVDVTFFGRTCKANPLLAQLARHVDCPIHGTRIVRLPDGNRFRVELTEAIEPAARRRGQDRRRRAPCRSITTRGRRLGARAPGAMALAAPPLAVTDRVDHLPGLDRASTAGSSAAASSHRAR